MKTLKLTLIAVICFAWALLCLRTQAAITVVDYYRLGEADAGAANGGAVTATTADSVGAKPLTRIGSPTYTNGISAEAALHTGSQLAASFSGSGQSLSNGVIITVTDNFGIEAWARPNLGNSSGVIVYNGNTATSGWGIFQNGTSYSGLFGGVMLFGTASVTAGGWAHLALVRDSGITTLYVNGAAVATDPNIPHVPTSGFGIGQPGQSGASQNFNGLIDEVRVFTFAAGQFSTNDLLLSASTNISPLTMTAGLQTDVNGNGRVNPGDTLRYTVVITNSTGTTLSNAVFNALAISNASLVGGSLKATPLARSDAPTTNSAPGSAFHGPLNTTLNIPSVSGLLANDFLGLPAGQIASFGGGSFPGTVTTTAAGATATAAGIGALTVNADGSVTFTPNATFNGLATFQYRLANSAGTNDTTGTLAIGIRPSATGDSFNVTGNTTIDSSLIPTNLLANDAGTAIGIQSTTPPTHGTVSVNAAGNIIYTPAVNYLGADSFNYTITNGFGGVSATVSFFVASRVWYIDSSVAVNGDGRSTSPFKQTSDFAAVNDAGAGHPLDSDLIFLRQGTAIYTGGVTLRGGQRFLGDGLSGTFNSVFGFPLAPGSAKAPGVPVPGLSGVRPFISTASGAAITLNSGNTVAGMNIKAANGRALSGTSVGSLVISNVAATAVGDRAVSLATGTVNVVLDTVLSTNSLDNGINLAAINGSFVANGGFIIGATGAEFLVSGGTSDITYAGGINNTSGYSVDIHARVGGTVTLSGNITDTAMGISVQSNTGGTTTFSGASKSLSTGANTAVTLLSNGGHTINFTNGGLVITTTAGTGFSATSGALAINVTGTGNMITSTTGTALNLVGATIGASGLTFQRISASGAANGIVLNNTGGGGLSVTGTGSVNSGGTIQNVSGDAILLSNASGVSLTDMVINTAAGSWIDATSVNGLTLVRMNAVLSTDHGFSGNSVTNLTIQGGIFGRGGAGNGSGNFNGFNIVNLLGTSSVSGATFSNANTINFRVNNNIATSFGGTPDTLTVSGTTWKHPSPAGPFTGDHLSVNSDTGANFRLVVTNSSGPNTFVGGGIAVQATAGGVTGKMDAQISGITSGGSIASGNANTAGVVIGQTGTGSITYDVHNNITLGTGSVAIKLTHASTGGTSTGKIYDNTITHIAGPGTDALAVDLQGVGAVGGTATVLIKNNTITGNYQRGIKAQSGQGNPVFNVTIDDNHLTGTDTTSTGLQQIDVEAGLSGSGSASTMRLNMLNNDVILGPGATYISASRLVNRAGNTFQLQNFTGNGALAADVQSWVTTVKANSGTPVTVTVGAAFTASAGNIPTPP